MKRKIPSAFFFKFFFTAVIFAVCAAVSFISCSYSRSEKNVYAANTEDVLLLISEKEPFDRLPPGVLITGNDLGKGYAERFFEENFSSFSSSLFSDFAIYPSAFSNSPSEYGIFRLSSEKNSGSAANMLMKRFEHLRAEFSDSESALEMIGNAEIRKNGLYIYYAVTNMNEHVLTEIENALVCMID